MKKKSISKRKVVNDKKRSRSSFRKKVSKSTRKNKLRKNKKYDGMDTPDSDASVGENYSDTSVGEEYQIYERKRIKICDNYTNGEELTHDILSDIMKNFFKKTRTLLIVLPEDLRLEEEHNVVSHYINVGYDHSTDIKFIIEKSHFSILNFTDSDGSNRTESINNRSINKWTYLFINIEDRNYDVLLPLKLDKYLRAPGDVSMVEHEDDDDVSMVAYEEEDDDL
jgi:hypothetical protein